MAKPGRRPAINPKDVLEVLKESDELFHSTREIAEHFDASKPTVLDRLRTLKEQGQVQSRKIAGNTPIWYLPEVENRSLDEYDTGNGAGRDDTDGRRDQETQEVDAESEVRADGGRAPRLKRWTTWLTADGALITGVGLIAASVANERWLTILAWIAVGFVGIAFALDSTGKAAPLGEWLANRRRRINEAGGTIAFLWTVVQQGSLGPTDPDTPVERVARLDIVAGGIFAVLSLLAVPLWAAIQLRGIEWVISVLTPKGALGLYALLNGLLVLGFVLLYLSAFASFAIGSRHSNDHPDPTPDVE